MTTRAAIIPFFSELLLPFGSVQFLAECIPLRRGPHGQGVTVMRPLLQCQWAAKAAKTETVEEVGVRALLPYILPYIIGIICIGAIIWLLSR